MLGKLYRWRRIVAVSLAAVTALAIVNVAGAQEEGFDAEAAVTDLTTGLDTAWLLLAAFLVFFMQLGFAMVEAGFVRAKNTTNILMKNVLDACIGGIAFFAVGYGLAYGLNGAESNMFFGDGHFFLNSFDNYAFWIFQFAFAATAATIVSGCMAERTKFSAYLVYTAFISALVYPIVVHWAWDGNGWLANAYLSADAIGANGYMDFAGSGVVHMVGGTAGLVGAIIVGPRIGKFTGGKINAIPGHSIALGTLGMFVLWVGWYGFNPGSTLALSGGFAALAAKVAVTTTLAACAGGVTAVVLSKLRTGAYDMGLTINGILGGLVGITASCAIVDPWASIVIGAVGAAIVMAGVELLDRLHIDDPVGAAPVHLGAGLWGVLAVGLFATDEGITAAFTGPTEQYGLLVGGGAEQLGVQALGAAAIVGWTAVTSAVLFLAIKYTIGLRVSEQEELEGLDQGEHGASAYNFGDVVGAGTHTHGASGSVPSVTPGFAGASNPAAQIQ
ncbi:MAG TPA: ammonium transporter [Dehalococcoidia bacterium]|nr:ammonium transporter [Dehalococcoidia bacterium]